MSGAFDRNRTSDYKNVVMSFAAAAVEVRPLSRFLKALADETRLRIVALLSHGELCVCHVEEALGLRQANVSRQFGILRAANVVEARRDGSWVYYRLAPQSDADCKRLLRTLVGSFARRDLLRKDVEKLMKVRGPGSCKR
jgi:ArsR family transcriptional regulator